MKKIVFILTIIVFAVAGFAPLPSALAQDQTTDTDPMGGFTHYYANHPTTVQQLISTWGKPAQVIKYENGVEKYVFKIRAIENDEIRFVVRNGKVVGCL